MSEYVFIIRKIFNLGGISEEFIVQMILVSLLFLPCKKRSFFLLRFIFSTALIVFAARMFVVHLSFLIPCNYALVFVLYVLLILFCYRFSFLQSLFVSVCIYGIQHIGSAVSYIITFILSMNGKPFDLYCVVMPLTFAVLLPVAYFICVRPIVKAQTLEFNHTVLFISVVVFLLVVIFLLGYSQAIVHYLPIMQIILRIGSILFTTLTLIVCFLNVRNSRMESENKILQLLLEKDKQQYEAARLSNEKISIKYHDLKRLQNEMTEEKAQLFDPDVRAEALTCAYFTGNNALDIVLMEKAIQCEHAGIRFVCTADGSALSFMKPYHVYSLIGNALENAIEALKKVSREEVKEITTSVVRYKNTSCVIKIENYVEQPVKMYNGLPVSTKNDRENHGYGSKSIKSVVEFYGGKIYFYEENHIFTMFVIIPIPETTGGGKTTS